MGRFQPFHLGHLELVYQTLRECDEAIIAVTGSQFNYIDKNPFTAGERIDMIYESLRDTEIDPNRYMVLGIENQNNVAVWVSYLRAALPKFDRIYSGNSYVSMLLAGSYIPTIPPDFVRRESLNATAIRNKIREGDKWQSLVPDAVVRHLERIGGVERIKTIGSSDTDPTRC